MFLEPLGAIWGKGEKQFPPMAGKIESTGKKEMFEVNKG
jgi:hypothetical protein